MSIERGGGGGGGTDSLIIYTANWVLTTQPTN